MNVFYCRYVSRMNFVDSSKHVVLGTQQFRPKEFATQIALNMDNAWGIFRCIVDICLKLPEGKYIIVKDPQKVQWILAILGTLCNIETFRLFGYPVYSNRKLFVCLGTLCTLMETFPLVRHPVYYNKNISYSWAPCVLLYKRSVLLGTVGYTTILPSFLVGWVPCLCGYSV